MHTTHHTTARSIVEEMAASAPGGDTVDIGTTVDIVSSAFAQIQESIGPIDMTLTVNEGVFGVWVHILARRPDGAVVNIKVDDEIIVHVNGRPFLYPSSGETNGWPMTSLGLIEALGDTGLVPDDVAEAPATKGETVPAPEERNVYQDTLSPAETNKALNRELAGLRLESALDESVLSALGWAFMHATALHRPFSIKTHGPADRPYAVLTGTTREGVETTVVVSRSAVTTVRTDEYGIVGNDCADQRAMSPEDLVEVLGSSGVMGFDAQDEDQGTTPSTDPETFVSVLAGSPKIVRSTVRGASPTALSAGQIAGALRPVASNLDDVLYARTAGALSLVTAMPGTYVTEHNGRDALTLLFEAPDPDGVRTHGVHVTRRGVYPLRGTETLERLLPTWLLSVEAVAAALERIEGVELAETSREDAADPVLHESIGLEGSTVTAVLPDSDGKSLIIDLRTPDGIHVTLHRARV